MPGHSVSPDEVHVGWESKIHRGSLCSSGELLQRVPLPSRLARPHTVTAGGPDIYSRPQFPGFASGAYYQRRGLSDAIFLPRAPYRLLNSGTRLTKSLPRFNTGEVWNSKL